MKGHVVGGAYSMQQSKKTAREKFSRNDWREIYAWV